jgi:hypothetical protein
VLLSWVSIFHVPFPAIVDVSVAFMAESFCVVQSVRMSTASGSPATTILVVTLIAHPLSVMPGCGVVAVSDGRELVTFHFFIDNILR